MTASEERHYVVAEAVFAGEDIEELPLHEPVTVLAPLDAELPRLTEDLLVDDGPRDRGDGKREHKEPYDLLPEMAGIRRMSEHSRGSSTVHARGLR